MDRNDNSSLDNVNAPCFTFVWIGGIILLLPLCCLVSTMASC